MFALTSLLVWNVAVATGLAVLVALVGHLPFVRNRPSLRHWLWLLVLVVVASI